MVIPAPKMQLMCTDVLANVLAFVGRAQFGQLGSVCRALANIIATPRYALCPPAHIVPRLEFWECAEDESQEAHLYRPETCDYSRMPAIPETEPPEFIAGFEAIHLHGEVTEQLFNFLQFTRSKWTRVHLELCAFTELVDNTPGAQLGRLLALFNDCVCIKLGLLLPENVAKMCAHFFAHPNVLRCPFLEVDNPSGLFDLSLLLPWLDHSLSRNKYGQCPSKTLKIRSFCTSEARTHAFVMAVKNQFMREETTNGAQQWTIKLYMLRPNFGIIAPFLLHNTNATATLEGRSVLLGSGTGNGCHDFYIVRRNASGSSRTTDKDKTQQLGCGRTTTAAESSSLEKRATQTVQKRVKRTTVADYGADWAQDVDTGSFVWDKGHRNKESLEVYPPEEWPFVFLLVRNKTERFDPAVVDRWMANVNRNA